MAELARLQDAFLHWLIEGDKAFAGDILGTEKVSSGLRMEIYRNAYRQRLLEALTDSYPALHTLLGDARFEALGLAYIETHPSRNFSIRWFGHRLRAFLTAAPDYRETPVLAEMAAFEWALRDAFDAADTRVLGLDDLRAIAPEAWAGMGLRLHPSLRRLDLSWNAPQLWSAIDRGGEPIASLHNQYPVGWVVWRRGLQTFYRSLEVDEARALDAAADGESFGAICAGLTEWVDELNAPRRAAGMVGRWVEEGLIAEVTARAGSTHRLEACVG